MFLKYNFNKVKNIIPLQKNSEHMSKMYLTNYWEDQQVDKAGSKETIRKW